MGTLGAAVSRPLLRENSLRYITCAKYDLDHSYDPRTKTIMLKRKTPLPTCPLILFSEFQGGGKV